jgi:hypothetical protein
MGREGMHVFLRAGDSRILAAVVLLAVVIVNIGFGASYVTEVDVDGPIAWWRFEDASSANGLMAADSAGAFTGTYNGDVVFESGIPGEGGQSARFDGNLDSVLIGDMGLLPVAGSIEFWMYSESVSNFRNPFTTGPLGGHATGNRAIRFEENSAGPFALAIGDDTATSLPQFTRTLIGSTQTEKWYHVVTTWNTNAGLVTVFVDNLPVLVDTSNTNWPSRLSAVAIGIGWNSLSARLWLGRMDEVALYDYELNAARIDAHYSAGTVSAAGDLGIALQDGGTVRLTTTGVPNKRYLVRQSTDFNLWTSLTSVTADPQGEVLYDDADASLFRQRFYTLADLGGITAEWDGGGDGESWNDVLNWSGNVVPGEFDNVLIDVSTGAGTIIHPSGATTVNRLSLIGSLNVTGGSLTVLANSFISGDLTVNSGQSIIADGADTHLSVLGTASIDEAQITATNGARISIPMATTFEHGTLTIDGGAIELPALTSIDHARINLSNGAEFVLSDGVTTYDSSGGMGTNENRTMFSADGAGTRLDLSSLVSMDSQFSGLGGIRQLISATDGGAVDLSGVLSITGGGTGQNGGGPLEFFAETGGSVDLPLLNQVTGNGAGVFFNMDMANFDLPQLSTATIVMFELPAGGTVDAPLLTSLEDSAVTIEDGESFLAPLLTNFTNSTLTLAGTGISQSGTLEDADHSRFILSGGAVFTLPSSLTTYDSAGGMGTNENRTVFLTDGDGTLLDLSSLESINSQFSGLGGLRQLIAATNGGGIDLSGAQSITGGGSGPNGGGPLEFSTETGGTIDCSTLNTVTGTGTGAGVRFDVAGNLALNTGTTTVTDTSVETDTGGVVTVGTLTLSTNSSLSGNGTVQGDVLNQSMILPGLSAGGLTIDGAYTQSGSGALEIEIGGTVAVDDFDQLVITGAASLAGTLGVTLIDGFNPTAGEQFKAITWGSSTGTFDTLDGLDAGAGITLDPNYNSLDFTLQAVSEGAGKWEERVKGKRRREGEERARSYTTTRIG